MAGGFSLLVFVLVESSLQFKVVFDFANIEWFVYPENCLGSSEMAI